MHAFRSNIFINVLLVLLILGAGALFLIKKNVDTPATTQGHRTNDVLVLAGQSIAVEVATTPEAQSKGLSGRVSLPEGTGMLFWFTKDGLYPFWMPDMHFPIDILWLDSHWSIVHIEEGVSPESYPATFASPLPARYVLELPAGYASKIGAKIGDSITFPEGKS